MTLKVLVFCCVKIDKLKGVLELKFFISTILSAILLFTLSACGGSSEGSSGGSTSPKQSQTANPTKKTGNNSASNNSTTNSNDNTNTQSTNNSQNNEADIVTNAVIKATLDVESKKPDTTVDYNSKTMTQSGQKVGFEIVAAQDHQEDFKAGTIKEKNNNGVDNVTLFQYKVDQNNQLSLLETTTLNTKNYQSVVYATTIGSSKTKISSGKDAITYLKNQLNMNNADIVFDDMGGDLKTDNIGSYYQIKLISKSLVKSGGSGTAGLYNVYQDGTYLSLY